MIRECQLVTADDNSCAVTVTSCGQTVTDDYYGLTCVLPVRLAVADRRRPRAQNDSKLAALAV